MFNNYDDERPNPIFKIMAQYKLINNHNKDEETSINNEIKKENDYLPFSLNEKKMN